MLDQLDYVEAARVAINKGHSAKKLLEHPEFGDYGKARFKDIFQQFIRHDPQDIAGLQLLCVQAKELGKLIDELECRVMVGEQAAESLAAEQHQE